MDVLNIGTKERQELIKAVVDEIKAETTLINTKVNEPAPQPKIMKSKVFTSSGTFTVPKGVTEVYLTGCGGGGGGSGPAHASPFGTSGGITSFGSLLSLNGGRGAVGTSGGTSGGNGGGRGADGSRGGNASYMGNGGAGGSSYGSGGAGGGIGNGLGGSGGFGGGGGGAGSGSDYSSSGSGGGGAQCVHELPLSVTPNSSHSIKIGSEGAAGANNAGGNGGQGLLIVKWWE